MSVVARAAEAAASSPRMFWLDGGGARPWSGRRSIIGALAEEDVSLTYHAAEGVVRRHQHGRAEPVGDDVFSALVDEVARDRGDAAVSWVGYLGYASRHDLPAAVGGPAPDAVWMRLRSPQVISHRLATGRVAGAAERSLDREPDPAYVAAFAEVQRQLRLGNTYEVNLTYRLVEERVRDPLATYLRLRLLNPAPYAGFLRHHDTYLLSSSPERFATVDRHGWLETKPIKGTTPRGDTPEEDERQRRLLLGDTRFRAENLMVTDLLRNDLSSVCAAGTVEVPALMQVESYPSVHQLVTTVRGRLRSDVTTIGALRALFPAGSMTGAPKRRTMEVIEAVEGTPRGVYAGAFGWVSGDGRADLGVVIRSLVATPAAALGWRYELGTGGGITVRSDLASEWAETLLKSSRLLAALH